ncbi:MAG: hypothetical protein IT370_08775 [Deltaproteobacteria bacterium]|nr:hypothetical protein [Deltaproteobacteria bacterium]
MLSAVTAHAAGKITVTLDGKAVTAVPVDRLPDIQIKVDAGAAYNKFYKGQWGKLEHALNLSVTGFDKGAAAPSADSVSGWAVTRIEYTGANKGWGSAKATSPKTSVVLRQGQFYRYSSQQSVMLAVTYERQYYTGKLVPDGNGKLIKETAWQTAGPVLATTVLSLEKPTFVAKYDAKAIAKAAEAVANTKGTSQDGASFAEAVARHILYPNTYNDQKVNFAGSKAKGFKPDGEVAFNWNWDEASGTEYVAAVQPVTFALHGKNTIHTGQFPKPTIVEGDFQCVGGSAYASRPIAGSVAFAFKENTLQSGLREGCKTADGKLGGDLAAAAKGPMDDVKDVLEKTKGMSDEERAAELIKKMGMDPNAK